MKNATVSARVEQDVKTAAENILDQLGITTSAVINSLYRQIILQRAVPFSLALPENFITADEMTTDDLNAKLARSYSQSLSGQGRDYNSVFDELEKEL